MQWRAQQVGHSARGTRTFSLTAGSCKQLPERVLPTAALTPASDFHKHLSQPPAPSLEPPAHLLPPLAPWPPQGRCSALLLGPRVLTVPCAPTALEVHLHQPPKTGTLAGTRAHPVPPLHALTVAAPARGCPQSPALPALLSPQELPRELWPHLPAPHCSHGD